MRKSPTKARFTMRTTLLTAAALLLAACAGETSTSPAVRQHAAPISANMALLGAVDGSFTFTINPAADQTIQIGASSLVLPANSICDLVTSGYGPDQWNAPCAPETAPVVITAVVRNALSNNPSIEFQPAMRFNPATNVQLNLFVTNAETLSNMTTMLYCGPFAATCVDESQGDASLATVVNKSAGNVSRRIKHFSGYVVAE